MSAQVTLPVMIMGYHHSIDCCRSARPLAQLLKIQCPTADTVTMVIAEWLSDLFCAVSEVDGRRGSVKGWRSL